MKRKTTVYVDDAVLRALKIAAARSGQHDYEVVEQALRAHLGMDLLQRAGAGSKMTEKDALNLSYQELHRSRKRSAPRRH